MTYSQSLTEKKYQGNVVIRFIGEYFAIRLPDSGLSIPTEQQRTIQSVIVNKTSVDLKRVNQTISNYSFKLVDRANILTALVRDRADALLNQEVEIWVGRSNVEMDFSDYFKLPKVRIKKVEHSENTYFFSCTEATDRMNKPVFNVTGKLSGSILSGTTTFTLQEDITSFPVTGTGKIDNEFFSWSGKDNTLKQLTGVLRGLKGTTAVAHDLGANISWVYDVTDNPINILLKLLISGSGGGTYDSYPSGLAIPESLIDITEIENLRDTIFLGQQFSFSLYNINKTLDFLENEILLPCNLRFRVSADSKISLALLDQAVFGLSPNSIDESSIASYPKWDVDDNKIVNVVEVQFDYDEGLNQYQTVKTFKDAQSILDFGERSPYRLKFKGIKTSLAGVSIIQNNIERFLLRFATPNPEISFKTHIDKHLLNVGDKTLVQSSQIPTEAGTLQFASDLEIISRGINFETGDVNFSLAFTSYTGIRGCYISPSDYITTVINQKTITVPAGRGDCYSVGWNLVLWNETTQSYESDPFNTIESIVGDTITFANNFSTTLQAGVHRLKFVDYDDATQDQRRYCYVSDSGLNFDDNSSTYRVLF